MKKINISIHVIKGHSVSVKFYIFTKLEMCLVFSIILYIWFEITRVDKTMQDLYNTC